MSPIDYDAIAQAGGIGKGTPRVVQKALDDRERQREDERENAKARKRANGRCEIWIDGQRCKRKDTTTHHMLGGSGVRARGESRLAARKQRACLVCHELVQRETKVRRVGGAMPHWTDRYVSLVK